MDNFFGENGDKFGEFGSYQDFIHIKIAFYKSVYEIIHHYPQLWKTI